MTLPGWLSAQEIADSLGATLYRVNQALWALDLYNKWKRPRNDARRRVYPPDTKDKVDEWLQTH